MSKKIAWFSLAGVVAICIALNFTPLYEFFITESDPYKLTSHTLLIKNAKNQDEPVVFNISQKYLESHVRREGKSFVIRVAYPDRSYEKGEPSGGRDPRGVSIFIAARDMTVGDQLKSAMDDGTLQQRFRLSVLEAKGSYIDLKEQTNRPDDRVDFSKLFYDEERLHWIRNKPAYMTLNQGEGMMKNLPVYSKYTYRSDLQPDPRVMHEGVMKLVEDLQTSNPQTPSKK